MLGVARQKLFESWSIAWYHTRQPYSMKHKPLESWLARSQLVWDGSIDEINLGLVGLFVVVHTSFSSPGGFGTGWTMIRGVILLVDGHTLHCFTDPKHASSLRCVARAGATTSNTPWSMIRMTRDGSVY